MNLGASGSRILLILAALFGASGVALGAFGAHGLKNLLEPRLLEVFNTAVQYQLLHAVALLALALGLPAQDNRAFRRAAWAWVIGILLFSGSLYAYILSYTLWGMRYLAMITPLGGVFFILGWLVLGWAAWKLPKD